MMNMVKIQRELTYYTLKIFVICFYKCTFALSLGLNKFVLGSKYHIKNLLAHSTIKTQMKNECLQMLKMTSPWMYSI